MKTSKFLLLSLVVCCLLAGNVFAVCTVGMKVTVTGFIGGEEAVTGSPGDVIEYLVEVDRVGLCALANGEVSLFIPNGSGGAAVEFDLADGLAVAAEGYTSFTQDKNGTPLTYTISAADLGLISSPIGGTPDSDEVRVYGSIVGDSIRDEGGPQNGGAIQNFDTRVIDPDICVTKSVECDISAPGYEVDYKILIENCGDTELELVSVLDSLADDLTTAAIDAGCLFLAPDGEPNSSCEITYSLEVLPEDLLPEPNLINDVNVVYSVIGTDITVQDTDELVVNLIDPNFTVMKECVDEPLMVGSDANFLVTIENTGTADLILSSSEIDIEPNLLPAGETYIANILQTVEICEDASNTIFVYATLPPDLCFALDEPLEDSASAVCAVIDPNFTVEKNCLNDPVPADANAMFEIVITNTSCGDIDLTFDVNDPAAGLILTQGDIGPIAPGPENAYRIPIQLSADCEVDESIINIVYVEGFYDGGSIGEKEAMAECPVDPCRGDEGCTPGYWKNSPDCWCATYIGNPKLCTIFDLNCDTTPDNFFETMGQKKMMAALSFKGGSKKKYKFRLLLKHAVAALLNACNDSVNYPLSESEIIDTVNDVINNYGDYSKSEILALKNEFDMYNNLGCPISADNSANPCSRNDD